MPSIAAWSTTQPDQVSAGPENSTTCVIEMDGAAVGRLRLVVAPDRIEIAGIQVLPARQGHGIGTAVIRNVLDRAEHERVPVVLDVENDNPGARRLYERLGFTAGAAVTGDRRPLTHDPRPSTLPMTAARVENTGVAGDR